MIDVCEYGELLKPNIEDQALSQWCQDIKYGAATERFCFVTLQQAGAGCERFNQANHSGSGVSNYTLTLELDSADT